MFSGGTDGSGVSGRTTTLVKMGLPQNRSVASHVGFKGTRKVLNPQHLKWAKIEGERHYGGID